MSIGEGVTKSITSNVCVFSRTNTPSIWCKFACMAPHNRSQQNHNWKRRSLCRRCGKHVLVGTLYIVKDETAIALRMRHRSAAMVNIVPKTISSALGCWVDDIARRFCCARFTVCYIDIPTDEWIKHKIEVEYAISNLP